MCDSSHVREGFPLHIVVTTGDSTDALEIIAKKLHERYSRIEYEAELED